MIVEVRLPEISENVASGDVTKVLVAQGDTVAVDQPLIELETEKAVFEVPSTAAGVVAEITLSPKLKMKAELDIHIEAWIEKIFSRIGWPFDQTPYYSLADLLGAFQGLVDMPETFEWRGIELFWARNKGV